MFHELGGGLYNPDRHAMYSYYYPVLKYSTIDRFMITASDGGGDHTTGVWIVHEWEHTVQAA